MNQQENLAVYFAEMLAKQNATPEEKKIQALIKAALYSDSLITFIDEVSKVFYGYGKVNWSTCAFGILSKNNTLKIEKTTRLL